MSTPGHGESAYSCLYSICAVGLLDLMHEVVGLSRQNELLRVADQAIYRE